MFSPNEKKLLQILGRKKLTIQQLTDKFYADQSTPPLNAEIIVGNLVRRINKKCEFLKGDWRLAGKGLGRHGKTVWKEPTPSRYR